MHNILLSLHNTCRWIIMVLALWATARALINWFGKKDSTGLDNKPGFWWTLFMDLQLVGGLILYVQFVPWQAVGEMMKVPQIRFFIAEHLTLMVLAVALLHIGRIVTRKNPPGVVKNRKLAIYYLSSLLCMLVGIPWWRPLFPSW